MEKLIALFICAITVGFMQWTAVSAEYLHNGIELSHDWPPRGFESLTREPQRIPYLEEKPPVVRIDVGRQLFVDDFLIERTTLRREWHYPVKYGENPILKPETALEINRPTNSTARVTGGGIWWDPTRNVYRMWYEAGWLGTPAYAESDDGLSWRRVNLDVVPGTNRVLPEGTPRFDGWVVTPDFAASEPYANWRMFVRPPGPGAQTTYVATSKDGLHWSELRPAGPCGDASSLFYNPFCRKWVFSLRNEIGPWGKGGSRIRSYREADDFLSGAQWNFALGRSTEDVVLWLQPDVLEPRDTALRLQPQLYDVVAVAYESLMVGGLTIWKGPENDEIAKNGLPKITDLCFAFSRDGYHFSRGDRTPAVASERWASKKWDAGYIRPMPNLLVVQDERILVYYGAMAGNTNRLEIGGFTCDLNGCYDQGASGVAILRRDGFVSMRPDCGRKSGELVTRPLQFSGGYLFVNAEMSNGTLRVEVLDEDEKPLSGYSAAESSVVSGDCTKHRVTWLGGRDLGDLAGRTVRFRFLMEGEEYDTCDLYAFWVSSTPNGESGGYLGGGGSAYGGVRDLPPASDVRYLIRPDARHTAATRLHTGIPSIAIAPSGRMWATYYGGLTGGEDSNNYCILATSADGLSWEDVLIADPDGVGPRRAFDPEVWVSPDGRLSWTWTERVVPVWRPDGDQYAGCWADPKFDRLMSVEFDADALPPDGLKEPRQVARGVMMCKPTVLTDGAWLWPVAHWFEDLSACFYLSRDGGRTFSLCGGITVPKPFRSFDEHTLVQLKNGDLLSFVRTVGGTNVMESLSKDGGRNWTKPVPARFKHTSSRIFVGRLNTGSLLLVKNGGLQEDAGRTNLTAFVSRDDGRTWSGGLVLDDRMDVSYPDGDQSADGMIHVVYDHDRMGKQEILLASFTEDDVLAGHLVCRKSSLRGVVTARRSQGDCCKRADSTK